MTLAEKVFRVLAAGALVLLSNVSGRCGEPQGDLELVVETADDTLTRGEALVIDVALRNAGREPLALYHPESIHVVSSCWSLTCEVTRPDGRVLTLAPEITFAKLSLEECERFRQLEAGDTISLRIHLQADDPSATHTPSGWVGLIPISKAEYELFPEGLIKRLHGIRGGVFFVGGSETHLAIRDVVADVFNRPGEYRLEFDYENHCGRCWIFSMDGKSMLEPVDRAWTGRLSSTFVLTIGE